MSDSYCWQFSAFRKIQKGKKEAAECKKKAKEQNVSKDGEEGQEDVQEEGEGEEDNSNVVEISDSDVENGDNE